MSGLKYLKHRLKRYAILTAFGIASAIVVGCATVDTTTGGAVGVQRKQWMSNMVSSAEVNQAAGQQYTQIIGQARQQKKLDTQAAQTQRVQKIMQRLVQQVGVFRPDARDWPWEIHVIDDQQVNAWCMPNGKMAVYSGLIQKLQLNDDELAAVIGHEIAHALREHSREQLSQQVATQMGLSVLSAILGSPAVGDLGSMLSDVVINLPNSRTQEAEADRMGVELAARAGFDPRAAVSLWQKMAQQGGAGSPEFLSTHPSPTSRIAQLEQAAQQVMPLYEASSS
ncbi:MAG TPA: M48 family metallopeptidase [Paenalcaligenes sp.]|nr:M48 family metallopeptidase [Paenalcaligenes sp.]